MIRHGMLCGYFDLGKPLHGKPPTATWDGKFSCIFIVFRINLSIDWEGYRVGVVLRSKYPGDMAAIEGAVRGAYMGATVVCPALGNLPTDECRAWRLKAKSSVRTNALRVRMINACQLCPLNKDHAK